MKKLILMTLLFNGCSHFPYSGEHQRHIAGVASQDSPLLKLNLSEELIFANGANSVVLSVEIPNQEINPADLKLLSDIAVESGKFTFSKGVFSISIKPKVKSPNIKLMVSWKDQTSSIIELKTTLAPLRDKMVPHASTPNSSQWVSGLYYQRQDYMAEGQYEAFQINNDGPNKIVNAQDSGRGFDFEFDEQAKQNISLMISDAPNGTVSHTMHSLFTFFPRKFLPFVEMKNKQYTVTLPTGEQMTFAESGEIISGVFTEGPVDTGPDRFKRTYADLKYQGKGILMRANARGQMPQQGQFESTKIDMEYGLKYSADVLIINGTTGQRCRRPKIDFWPSEDVSPILFKFPSDAEFDKYLKAKCNFGIPELDATPIETEGENTSEIVSEIWQKCENDSEIKRCFEQESQGIEDTNVRSKVRFNLDQIYMKERDKEKSAVSQVLQKQVSAIRVELLSEATWVGKQSCLDKSKSLVKGTLKYHDIQELIHLSLVQNCSTIKDEMDKITSAEVAPLKEKLEANFHWASVSTSDQLVADCQKYALSLIGPEKRYHASPSIYLPAIKSICAKMESSPAYVAWLETQGAGLEEKVFTQLVIQVEALAEKQAIKCILQYPVDTQLNRMKFKKQRENCLVDNWFAIEDQAVQIAKQDPLVQKVNLSFDKINTRIAMERRRLQLKIMKKHFL